MLYVDPAVQSAATTTAGLVRAATDFDCGTHCRTAASASVCSCCLILTKLSAQFADEVVLNLASPQRVSQRACDQIDHRTPPESGGCRGTSRRGFWLRRNLGEAALRQLVGKVEGDVAGPVWIWLDVLRTRIRRSCGPYLLAVDAAGVQLGRGYFA